MQPNNQLPLHVNPDISGPRPMPQSPSSQGIPTILPEMPKPPKKKGPVIAITIAITLCILIIVGAITVFIIARNKTKQPAQKPQVTEVTKDSGRVSPDDIDNAKKNIDQSLNNIDDTNDFKTDDLTNTTLGL